jgi:hypothetical protein
MKRVSRGVAPAAMTSLLLVMAGGCVESGAPPAAAPAQPAAAAPCVESPGAVATAAPTATAVPTAAAPAPAKPADFGVLYGEAIARSAVVTPAAARKLVPLVPDAKGAFTVTTWAGCRGDGGPNKCGSYVAGQAVTVKWDVWVTGNNEVQNKCKTWSGDLILRVNQLLGLPAPPTELPADTVERQFVTFTGVPAASIFRPCTDTSVTTDSCNGTQLPEKQAANAPKDYWRWFTNQAMSSWQVSAGVPAKGFPWTRLGYTYDWAPDSKDVYGASEYVISGSAKEVKLTVAAVQTAKDFCKP